MLCTAWLAHFGGAFFISIFGQALDTFLLTMLLDNLVIRLLLLAHVCKERAVMPIRHLIHFHLLRFCNTTDVGVKSPNVKGKPYDQPITQHDFLL